MADMLTVTELAVDPDRFHLIVVRDAGDYGIAHVAGAAHIQLAELGGQVTEIPAGKIAVTICGKGEGRSTEGAALLRQLGHRGALWLEGGTNGWRQHDSKNNNRNTGDTG